MRILLKNTLLVVLFLSTFTSHIQASSADKDLEKPKAGLSLGPIFEGSDSTRAAILKELGSLDGVIKFASISLPHSDLFYCWDDIRKIYLPGVKTQYIRGYNDKNIESLGEAVRLAHDLQTKLKACLLIQEKDKPKSWQDIRRPHIENEEPDVKIKSIIDAEFIVRIQTAYTPEFASALYGYLQMAEGQNSKAQELFAKAGSTISVEAQKRLGRLEQPSPHKLYHPDLKRGSPLKYSDPLSSSFIDEWKKKDEKNDKKWDSYSHNLKVQQYNMQTVFRRHCDYTHNRDELLTRALEGDKYAQLIIADGRNGFKYNENLIWFFEFYNEIMGRDHQLHILIQFTEETDPYELSGYN